LPDLEIESEEDDIWPDENEIVELANVIQSQEWWKPYGPNPQIALVTALVAVLDGTPTNYEEAMKGPENDQWKQAMQDEINNIKRLGSYILKPLPHGEGAIGCRWVFKKGTVAKYKATLVAKGYLQKFGKHFVETFAPVAKFKTLRLLIEIAASLGLSIYHDDVTTAFLNGELKETIYMDQPKGFEEGDNNQKWLLLKALYGLKKSP
jgi:hypothetical protein